MLSQICVKKSTLAMWRVGVVAWRGVGDELRGFHSSPIRYSKAKTVTVERKRGWDGEIFLSSTVDRTWR